MPKWCGCNSIAAAVKWGGVPGGFAMATHQVEMLTREISCHAADASRVIASLPVEERAGRVPKSLIDFGARQSEQTSLTDESPLIRVFLAGLNWTAFALAIGAVLFLTWAVGESMLKQ